MLSLLLACTDLVATDTWGTERTGIVYELTSGDIDVHENAGGRTFHLMDAVFSPSYELELDTGFGDPTGLQPVDVGTVTLPTLPHGGAAGQIE